MFLLLHILTTVMQQERTKFEYKNLGLSGKSTAKFLRPCCIKFLKLLRMVSPTAKEEQSMRTLVATLLNHCLQLLHSPDFFLPYEYSCK